MATYVPESGDFIWTNFDPQSGREQAGHRPALVLSPSSYNRKAGLMVLCPITSHAKGYPLEVALPLNGKMRGAVLTDQIKCVDWTTRGAKKAGVAKLETMTTVREKLGLLLGMNDI